MFKQSEEFKSLHINTRRKVKVNKEFVRDNICRCFKKPYINECADSIRRNLDFSLAATMKLAKGDSNTFERDVSGDQARARAQELLVSKDALLEASYCEGIEREGMAITGKDGKSKPFTTPKSACKDRTCPHCKLKNNIFIDTLNADAFKLKKNNDKPLTVKLCCFENVVQKLKGGKEKKVMMKTSKQATPEEVFKRLQDDLDTAGPHIFADRWKRRNTELFYESMGEFDAALSADYTSTCTYVSDETVTCGTPNHGYCEVFVAQVKKRRVGGAEADKGVDVWTTIVYYFMGKASGENKDNDHVAHKVHEEYVINVSSHLIHHRY